MIVLDATVLVHAVGTDPLFREPCRRLVAAIAAGSLVASTTAEVIQEFVYLRGTRRGRPDAADLARDYIELLAPLLVTEESDLREGLRLHACGPRTPPETPDTPDTPEAGVFDAVLAATARASGAQALVSASTAFAGISGITHVVPDEAGVRGLLA